MQSEEAGTSLPRKESFEILYDVDFRNVVNKLPAVRNAGEKVGTEQVADTLKSEFIRTEPGVVTRGGVLRRVAEIRSAWVGPGRTADGHRNWKRYARQASSVAKRCSRFISVFG